MRNLKLVRSAKRNLLNNDMREVSDAHTKTLASDDLTRASGDRDQPDLTLYTLALADQIRPV